MSVAAHEDPLVLLRADLVRGNAAYVRDASEDLTDGARALRAKGLVLRRHYRCLRATSTALQNESDRLLRRLACEHELRRSRS